MSARDESAELARVVAREGALPVPGGGEPSELERLRGVLLGACDEVARLEAELGAASARVAELLAERHSTNEALSKRDVALQEQRDRIAELEALTPAPVQTCRKCGAGYDYGQPCSTCVFRARMAAELQARSLEGEHYPHVHHDYAKGRDPFEAGGQR